MTLLIILGVLFLALFLIIPMLEKSSVRISDEDTRKISRWIYPLMMLTIILSMIMYFVRS